MLCVHIQMSLRYSATNVCLLESGDKVRLYTGTDFIMNGHVIPFDKDGQIGVSLFPINEEVSQQKISQIIIFLREKTDLIIRKKGCFAVIPVKLMHYHDEWLDFGIKKDQSNKVVFVEKKESEIKQPRPRGTYIKYVDNELATECYMKTGDEYELFMDGQYVLSGKITLYLPDKRYMNLSLDVDENQPVQLRELNLTKKKMMAHSYFQMKLKNCLFMIPFVKIINITPDVLFARLEGNGERYAFEMFPNTTRESNYKPIALKHLTSGVEVFAKIIESRKLLTQYQLGNVESSFGKNLRYDEATCGDSQYPGVYTTIHWDNMEGKRLSNMPTGRKISLIFCKEMMNPYNWHYNSRDSNGYQTLPQWELSRIYTVRKNEWARFMQSKKKYAPDDDNELVFHEEIDFTSFLRGVWFSSKWGNERKIREILDANGFNNVPIFDELEFNDYKCPQEPWIPMDPKKNCQCVASGDFKHLIGMGKKPFPALYVRTAASCGITLTLEEAKQIGSPREFNDYIRKEASNMLKATNNLN